MILAGKEYGAGSSRDWAAKGTALLGVRAVIAESYERIHRSNLIGMGVVPLQFRDGDTAERLGLTGSETFDIEGLAGVQRAREVKVTATAADGKKKQFHRDRAHRHAEGAGLLHPRRHPAVRAAAARVRQAGRVSWFRRKPPDPSAILAERAAAKAPEQQETADKLDPGGLSLEPDSPAPARRQPRSLAAGCSRLARRDCWRRGRRADRRVGALLLVVARARRALRRTTRRPPASARRRLLHRRHADRGRRLDARRSPAAILSNDVAAAERVARQHAESSSSAC